MHLKVHSIVRQSYKWNKFPNVCRLWVHTSNRISFQVYLYESASTVHYYYVYSFCTKGPKEGLKIWGVNNWSRLPRYKKQIYLFLHLLKGSNKCILCTFYLGYLQSDPMNLIHWISTLVGKSIDNIMAFTHEKCHLLTWQYSNELLKTRQLLPLDEIVKCMHFQISFELCVKSCFNSATKPLEAVTNFCLGNLQKIMTSPSLPSPHGYYPCTPISDGLILLVLCDEKWFEDAQIDTCRGP